MNFTFLHAADLHLGSPLTGLALKDEDVARRFATASRDAFSDLVTRAIDTPVAFVLIAGDLYDGDWKDASIGLFFNREVARLGRAGIPVYLIRGNHDAESEITRSVPLPDTIVEFSTRKAETKRLEALNIAIHARSFAERAASENFALAYPAPVAGWFNIGMLHTSCEGNAAHAVYAPCTVNELVARNYDYWALGHVHEHAVLHQDPWVVYPGNLQGRSVRECGPKGAVLVDVADGRVQGVRRLDVDRARWLNVTIAADGKTEERDLLTSIGDALKAPLGDVAGRLTALRVTMTGRTPLHGRLKLRAADLRDEVQALANHVHDDVWLESLKIATTEPAAAQPTTPLAGGLDPEALLAGLELDPEVRERAAELITLVKTKLPGGLGGDILDDLDGLMADARTLAVARSIARPQE